MTCQRCAGLVVQEQDCHWTHFRCTSCGDRFDTLVLNHRWLYRELKLLDAEPAYSSPASSCLPRP